MAAKKFLKLGAPSLPARTTETERFVFAPREICPYAKFDNRKQNDWYLPHAKFARAGNAPLRIVVPKAAAASEHIIDDFFFARPGNAPLRIVVPKAAAASEHFIDERNNSGKIGCYSLPLLFLSSNSQFYFQKAVHREIGHVECHHAHAQIQLGAQCDNRAR